MKESKCNTEVVRSLKKIGWGAYKLPDVLGQRFTVNKPCDILACSPKGRFVAIESKLFKKVKGFNLSELRPNQIEALEKNSIKRKGRAFIFLFISIKADKSKGLKSSYELVVFDWQKYGKVLKKKPFSIEQIRSKSVGVWYTPEKLNNKIFWDFKKLLSN